MEDTTTIDFLKELFEQKSRAFGVAIQVGGRDKKVFNELSFITAKFQGRTDVVLVDSPEQKLIKSGNKNEKHGPALYWSSITPNLEYSVCFVESNCASEGESLKSILEEYWQVVRRGGVIVGDYNDGIKEVLDSVFSGRGGYEVNNSVWLKHKP